MLSSPQTEPINFCSNKNLPRYLYHLTTKENAARILQTGAMPSRTLNETRTAFYMFDLKNFLKRWTHPFRNYSNKLFWTVPNVHKSMDLVLLRVPVKNLNTEKLKIRSQIYLHCYTWNENIRNHKRFGDIAAKAKHYTRKKHPIEYMYLDSISKENIQVVGECKATPSIMERLWGGFGNAKELMLQLVNGKPEEKGVSLCKFGKIQAGQ